MSTTSLREFLIARVDERERLALAVTDGQRAWNTDEAVLGYGPHPLDEVVDWIHIDGAAEHMAANDPVSVLRDVAAKRAVLKVHCPATEKEYYPEKPGSYDANACAGCGWDGWDPGGYLVSSTDECETLRALAIAYDQHSDYDPAWRP